MIGLPPHITDAPDETGEGNSHGEMFVGRGAARSARSRPEDVAGIAKAGARPQAEVVDVGERD